MDQEAMGRINLKHAKACVGRPSCRRAEGRDDILDVVLGHLGRIRPALVIGEW